MTTTDLVDRIAVESQASIDVATRREFITLLGAVGLLAACGADNDAAAPPNTDSATHRIDHALGSSELRPASGISAVVVLEGRRDLETAIALGLPVVEPRRRRPSSPSRRTLPGWSTASSRSSHAAKSTSKQSPPHRT